MFASIAHPQTNRQAEEANKTILNVLKKKLNGKNGRWAEEMPIILCSYQTTSKEATRVTSLQKAYGVEAVIPLEVQMSTLRLKHFNEEKSNEGLRLYINTIDENMALSRIISKN